MACGDSDKPPDEQASAPPARVVDNDLASLVIVGDLAGLRAAHQHGATLNQMLHNQWTLLHLAAAHGQTEIADWLIKQGLSPNSHDALGQQPFDLALVNGHADLVARLMPTEGDAAAQALLMAIRQGDLAVVEKALRHVSDVGALVESQGMTPLHQACLHRQADILRLLLTKTRHADVPDRHGRTPLHQASISGAVDCARLLIDAGTPVNVVDSSGYTPLHLATLAGDVPMVSFLLSRNADPQQASAQGTAAFLAAEHGHLDVLEVLSLPAPTTSAK